MKIQILKDENIATVSGGLGLFGGFTPRFTLFSFFTKVLTRLGLFGQPTTATTSSPPVLGSSRGGSGGPVLGSTRGGMGGLQQE